MPEYLCVTGHRAETITADTIEQAALLAAKGTSVLDLCVGVEVRVYPAEFAREVKVQYSDPDNKGPNERSMNYGQAQVVDEFFVGADRKRKLETGSILGWPKR